jgi:hypothetical protein
MIFQPKNVIKNSLITFEMLTYFSYEIQYTFGLDL